MTSKREFFVNFSTIADKNTLQDKLAACLCLPDYYGRNLDALHDCLTEMDACVTLSGLRWLQALGNYGDSVLRVFRDAAEENSRLTLIFND